MGSHRLIWILGRLLAWPLAALPFVLALCAVPALGKNNVYDNTILGDSPIAFWEFDEITGTLVADFSGSGYSGTLSGGATLGQPSAFPNLGTSIQFNGSSSYVSIPQSVFPNFPLNGNNSPGVAMSFETWFKTSSDGIILGQTGGGSVPGGVVNNGFNPALYVGTDGKLRSELLWHGNTSPITSSQVVDDNKWHYVTDVFNSGTETLYLDGKSIASASGLSLNGFANSYTYTIGTGYASSLWPATNNSWFYFNGSIDDPAVYNYALTPTQIAAHYSAASANSGTTYTWTNPASGGAWSNAANWSAGAIADGADNTADFSTLDITADNTVHLDSPRTIGNLVFGDATPSNNWIIDNNGDAANTLTLQVTTASSPRITVNNETATISSVVMGNQGFMKLGAGTLVLSGANTVSGTATVVEGTLQLGSANALQNATAAVNVNGGFTFGPGVGTFNVGGLAGTGNVALNDLTVGAAAVALNFTGSGTATYSGVLSGPGSVTSSGTGTQTLSGVNTYSGGTTVNAGRIISTTSASLGTGGVTLGGGSLRTAAKRTDFIARVRHRYKLDGKQFSEWQP